MSDLKFPLASLAVSCLLLWSPGPSGAQELTAPNLQRFEPSVREQLESLYLAATAADAEAAPEQQAASYGFLGETYLAYELADEAAAALAVAARLDPDESRWTYLQALAELARGNREQAASYFDDLLGDDFLSSDPEDLPALLRSAANLLDLGRTEQAAERYKLAQKLIGNEARPGFPATVHFGLGQVAALGGRYEEAADHFRRALELQPKADVVHYHLARALHRLGDTEGARAALSRRGTTAPSFYDPVLAAMQRRAEGPQADLLQGLKALTAGRLEQAEAFLRKVLDDRPADAEALAGLGRIHQARGEDREAEAAYRKSLESGESSTVLLNLGVLLARRDDAEAVEILRRAALADPGSSAAQYNLGLQLLRRRQAEEAEQALRRAVELAPGDAPALEALARAQAAGGDFGTASETYRRLVDVAPQNPDAHFALGLALTLSGRCGEAVPVLDHAVSTFGSDGPDGLSRTGLLARVLATCPDDTARDGARAVELAASLFQRAPGVETGRTLCMSLAEAGRTTEAAQQMRRLIDAASRAGATQALPALRRELESYERGEAVRSPWSG